MATQKKTAAPKTTLAGIQAFPAKTSKSATPAVDLRGNVGMAKKPTASPRATKKLADRADAQKVQKVKPSTVDAAVAKAKRTVSLADATRLSDVPDYEVHSVEDLRTKLVEFPRGSIFTVAAPFINVYNLRGRLIGRIKDGPKQKKAKTARADKL